MKRSPKKKVRSIWIRLIGIPLISLSLPIALSTTMPLSLSEWLYIFLLSLLITYIIWEGNSLIVRAIRRHFSWQKTPVVRLCLQSILTIAFSVWGFLIITRLFLPLSVQYLSQQNRNIIILSIIIVTLMISAIYEGIYFSRKWHFSVMRAEALKREALRTQYESLKNQINPHFLFNSLNTLSVLIDENSDEAVSFVHNLASAYRYLLLHKDFKLVSIEQEIKFTETYLALLKTRFGERLICDFQISESELNDKLPPLSLQILVENAVKYNQMSLENPLKIHIALKDTFLSVSNNLQPNEHIEEYAKLGLRNIRDRYKEFTQSEIEIINTGEQFIVKLPLI